MAEDKNKKDPREEKQKEHQAEVFRARLKYLKQAQSLYREEKVSQAIDNYYKYLAVLANNNNTTEDKLSPTMFDPDKDVSELLLISHVYWDLAKAFDRSPHHQRECLRCLDQFVKFSIGFKYQHVNAQIIRKFNNKKQAHNYKAFEQAYTKIHVSSKKCYVATALYGNEHPVTMDLRQFKLKIQHTKIGFKFIEFYYRLSPLLVEKAETSTLWKHTFQWIFKPTLFLVHRVIRHAFLL